MGILVRRFKSNSNATVSLVYIDGKFQCFGLEDEHRAVKVAGKTRIPAGVYPVGLRSVGGMTKRYAQKFPDFHKGMLHIKNVPGFTYIYIHIGNTDEHTEGCLLVGNGVSVNGECRLSASTAAYEAIYRKVADLAAQGDLTLTILDED